MNFQTILFDFDGTLSESGPGIIKAMRYGLTAVGIEEQDENILQSFIGPPLNVQLQKVYHLSPKDTLSVITKFREQYDNKGVYDSRLYPGIKNMLRDLYHAGKTLCVASSKPYPLVHKLLESYGISSYFTVKLGSDPADEMKNKAVFDQKSLIIRRTFEALVEEGHLAHIDDRFLKSTLMIGDKNYDILGAQSNHIASAGVTWGYGDEKELTDAGADYLFHSPQELHTFLIP